ncbi:LysR family transcriptional regulator [Parendozoicomonas sp. Alg238-R29]|uniref:LysR family transcriptional regulator n=1 Tax=Parendozoicomonas sp. Alg238-R29 TaxID=2993446 RepID=UPI00248E5D3F|nr:LysR family transcriptional regulator [Parendozoicomonas sp. Alg238-R29]
MLRIFVTIVNCSGFSAAQSVLNIGQSTISEYVSRLETRMGTRLCYRGRGGFRLTEAGEKVFESAQRLLSSVESFRQEVSVLTGDIQGELRLGLIDNTITNEEFPILSILKEFQEIHPNVHIHLETRSPHDLEQRILSGALHLAISPFPVHIQGILYEKLFDEQHLLYCGEEHPLFRKENVRMADIQQSPVVVHGYEHEADLVSIQAKVAGAIIDNMESEALLIMTGNYVGLLPNHYARQFEEAGKIKALLPETLCYASSFYLAHRKNEHLPVVLTAFTQHLRRFFSESYS